jgi:hypothetical protein
MIKDDEGNFISIREKLSVGGRSRLLGVVASGMTKKEDGSTDLKMDFGAYQRVLLEEGIVEWGGEAFLGEDGKIVPVSKTAISALDPELPLVSQTLTRLGELYKIANSGTSPNAVNTSKASEADISEPSTENLPAK